MELFRLFGSIIIDDQEAIKSLKNTDKKAKESKTALNDVKEAGKKIGGAVIKGATVAGGALAGLGIKGTKSADDLKDAVNQLQSSTGLAGDEADGLKDSMIAIYNQNLGEDFNDIADAMGEVYRQTGLTGEGLEDATSNAIVLRDTFGYDVSESMRAVEALMEQFGYTSDEAFNLIAQGAQGGLDKNGDMLDSINEYSVHFEQLGLDGEDMFDALKGGAENGAFSIDKVGDAFKEFGIRVKDESKGTTEAFETLGLDADTMTSKFAKGGEDAQEAYGEVTQALFNMKDPVEQNTAGVALFGTMWEDLGTEALGASTLLTDNFSASKSTMEDLNSIKYDSLGEAIGGIGRQFETGVLIPIGEKVLPKLNEFATYIEENMPQIREKIEDAFNKAGDAIQWVKDNLNWLIPVISTALGIFVGFKVLATVNTLMLAFKAVQTAVTTAGGLMNAVLALNPFTLIAIAIGVLIGVGVALYMNWDKVKEKAQALWAKLSEIWTNIKNKTSEIFNNVKETISNKITEAKNKVSEVVTNIKNTIRDKLTEAKNKVSEIFNNIKTAISNKITEAKNKVSDIFGGIKDTISEKVTGAKDKVFEVFDNIKNGISERITEAKNKVSDIFGGIKDAIGEKINGAKDKVSEAIDKIKGFFDFEFKWPKLKMPKFKITGSMNPIKWVKEGVPKLSVNWNAAGAIFDRPTIFNTPYGLQGVGEAGPEAVAPIGTLMGYVRTAVEEARGNQGMNIVVNVDRMDSTTDVDELMEYMGNRMKEKAYSLGLV